MKREESRIFDVFFGCFFVCFLVFGRGKNVQKTLAESKTQQKKKKKKGSPPSMKGA